MEKARLHMFILKLFLKMLIGGAIGILATAFIDDILLLPNFIIALYVITIGTTIVGFVGLFVIVIEISCEFDALFRDTEPYKKEIYNQIFYRHKNDKKNRKDYDF